MSTREELTKFWPTFGLRLRTPRLELRPVCDDDLGELIAVAQQGIHDPAAMPFASPWTDAPADEIPTNTLRYFWQNRAHETAERWSLQFAVRREGEFVGIQEILTFQFAVRRTFESGSWLGRAFQGKGLGTEMRAAVVMLGFDHLGALRAETAAFADNPASQAVSRKLGYVPNGDQIMERRHGERAVNLRFVVTPESFRRPDWTLQVDGLEPCRSHLGLPD